MTATGPWKKGEIRLLAGFDAWVEECAKLRIVGTARPKEKLPS